QGAGRLRAGEGSEDAHHPGRARVSGHTQCPACPRPDDARAAAAQEGRWLSRPAAELHAAAEAEGAFDLKGVYDPRPQRIRGEMAERSKALDWNSSNILTGVRGFESHSLRHLLTSQNDVSIDRGDLETIPSVADSAAGMDVLPWLADRA